MKVTLGKKSHNVSGNPVQKGRQASSRAEREKNIHNTDVLTNSDRELVGKRKYNSKFYANKSGNMTAELHDRAIHYLDPTDNTFRDIDNRLVDTGERLETRASTFRTRFHKCAKDGKICELERDGSTVVLVSHEAAAEGGCQIESCDCGDDNPHNSSKVIFKNVKGNTDFEYIVDSEKLKENIIIKEKAENYEFGFDLLTKNLVADLSKDGKRVELKKKQSGKPQFYIPAPFMTDADGNYSDSVYYEIEEVSDGMLNLKVIADKEWINSEGRAFPVTIDPQIVAANFYGAYYYGDEKYYSSIFRYKTIQENKQIGNELRIYCGLNDLGLTEYIESDLIILKDKIPYSLEDIYEVRLKAVVDNNRTKVKGGFSINYREQIYLSEDSYPQSFTIDITDRFRQSSGDVIIPFRAYIPNFSYMPTDVYFIPVLEIDYYNRITGIHISGTPAKKEYWPGDKFDFFGMSIKGIYLDGKSAELIEDVTFDYSPKKLATYDEKIKVFSVEYPNISASFSLSAKDIIIHEGVNDRRAAEGMDGVYKLVEYDMNNKVSLEQKYSHFRIELADGVATENAKGTPLDAKHLNNLLVKGENIRGEINEESLPEHLKLANLIALIRNTINE